LRCGFAVWRLDLGGLDHDGLGVRLFERGGVMNERSADRGGESDGGPSAG
jgi:hypothetical protein